MFNGPISRRTVLKGLGTAIALPCLEAMLPTTAVAATPAGAAEAPCLPLRAQRRAHAGMDAEGTGQDVRSTEDPRTA